MSAPAADLQSLRDQREALQLQAENAALEQEINYLRAASRSVLAGEVAWMQERASVIGDRNGYLYDSPGFARPNTLTDESVYHFSQLDDRLGGKNRPFYETETELAEIRGTCRVLAQTDEAGIGIATNLANYVVGTGFKYTTAARNEDDKQAIRLAELCQIVIDEFRSRTKWRRKEREFHDRSRRDGEILLQLEPLGGGYTGCRFREPDALVAPRDRRAADEAVKAFALDWSFGVATDIGRPDRIHAYFLDNTGDQRDFDILFPNQLIHAKRNVDEDLKRGLSDFFPVWQELTRAAKILRNTGEGAALQAAIAWVKEHVPGVTASQVQRLISTGSEHRTTRTTPAGNSKTTEYTKYPPGTILNVPHGTQYKPGPMGAERDNNFLLVADAIIRYAGLRWNMPGFMTTGGNDSKTFAGNLVSESPFVKSMEAEQIWYVEEYEPIFWRVLEIALSAESFRQMGISSLAQLKAKVSLNIKPPRVSTRNRKEETDIHAILYDKRLLSGRTWMNLEEFDYDHEQELIAEEPEPVPTQIGSSVQRPDMQQGEEQKPVQAIGTNRDRRQNQESRFIEALVWKGYP